MPPAPTCGTPLISATNDWVTSTGASGLLFFIQLSEIPVSAKTSARPDVTASIPSCGVATCIESMPSSVA